MAEWLIYGANGYSGTLIAREAVRQGLKPILAGRNASQIIELASELGLTHRIFSADTPDLSGVVVVLNCAGPFSTTARPMMAAAIAARVHYLDITGEIDVFEYASTLDAAARNANIVLCPGVGFDVIPTDCLALALKQALSDASSLCLGFESHSLKSPGTAKTTIEGIGTGTKIRRGGKLRSEPIGLRARTIDFGKGSRLAAAFPWGDVSTAFKTTGIPSITVYVAVTRGFRLAMLASNLLAPLLRLPAIRNRMLANAGAAIGPDAAARQNAPTYLWGEVRNPSGQIRTARIRTANGYEVTVHGALAVLRHIMGRPNCEPGFVTPALLCGATLIEQLPGSGNITFA
ncbi:saccharopine dehydrogenase family protein [Sphingorhabdus sp.]|jgi:short subunit dehydrogenase-like uncharacterized protein|uniref:saccharopine dehydrogenase family protein n=1 Tax=Sphingorhabdus sp. TaxID=1902408 RepID=UPI004048B6B8